MTARAAVIVTIVAAVTSLLASAAGAATCYVRDGGTATGTQGISTNGGSWSQAYDELSTAETNCARGDTIYVADGTYTGVTFNTVVSGTTLITINKATVSAHGTDTGWLDTYGDGVATFTSSIVFSTSYWVFDGIAGGGPGSWTSGFGFKISVNTGPGIQAPATNGGTTLSNVTVRHVEIQGNGGDGDGSSPNNDGIALFPQRLTSSTFEYMYIYDMGRTIFLLTGQNEVTFRYIYTGLFESTPGEHAELASIWADSGNVTFAYNIFTHIEGTGGLIWDNQGSHTWQLTVHGNVFVKRAGSPAWEAANGIISGWSGGGGEDFANVKVYNNTFINTGTGGEALGTSGVSTELNDAQNNLFYSVSSVGGSTDWATVSHNHFISSTSTGTNASTGTGDPFQDWANLDFRLTANTTAGVDLGSLYNTDMLGNTRTTWTRGAIEYTGGGGGGVSALFLRSVSAVSMILQVLFIGGYFWERRSKAVHAAVTCWRYASEIPTPRQMFWAYRYKLAVKRWQAQAPKMLPPPLHVMDITAPCRQESKNERVL